MSGGEAEGAGAARVPLSPGDLEAAVHDLPAWEIVGAEVAGAEPAARTGSAAAREAAAVELRRVYEFRSFEDAIDFMGAAAKRATLADHHPRWENSWRTVTVWLTTWDAGHRPTARDLDLARSFDEVYTGYAAAPAPSPPDGKSASRSGRSEARGG